MWPRNAQIGPDQVQFERFVITSKQLAFGVEEAKHKYSLRSIIVHKGDSVSHGHYEAYSQLPNSAQWIHCNDARTQMMNRDEILAKPEVQKNCYLVFPEPPSSPIFSFPIISVPCVANEAVTPSETGVFMTTMHSMPSATAIRINTSTGGQPRRGHMSAGP
ncbi:hypothetical protein BLNAU_13414 [Blattamonas nauphoetae]|uniref:USP domain-containing protein n=1 Tax=Blattamonas nauphoetae TaxID=2049346 RepID=A0ABQ9XKE5_9EUKA|nr:hypothetical protein BLNAU_13414 [Blattamonas nauphoetae]